MQNLIEKISSYKRATQGLLQKVNDFEKFIKENVPFEMWEYFDIYKCGGGNCEEYHIKIEGNIIPARTEKFGKEFYWGGDFNYRYDYVTGKELIEWCEKLPKLIEEASQYIDNMVKSVDETFNKVPEIN